VTDSRHHDNSQWMPDGHILATVNRRDCSCNMVVYTHTQYTQYTRLCNSIMALYEFRIIIISSSACINPINDHSTHNLMVSKGEKLTEKWASQLQTRDKQFQ